jgi:hypothetical protein
MAVTIIRKAAPVPDPKPEIVKPDYDSPLLQALSEVGSRPETLMLIHKETGEGWQVIEHDKATGYTVLKNNQGARLRPRISIREDVYYTPLWR